MDKFRTKKRKHASSVEDIVETRDESHKNRTGIKKQSLIRQLYGLDIGMCGDKERKLQCLVCNVLLSKTKQRHNLTKQAPYKQMCSPLLQTSR